MSNEHISLKWGTLKGWSLGNNEAAIAAWRRYSNGGMAAGCMQQHDDDAQKNALCDLIDAIDGPIWNDWSGKAMTKDEAKVYVRSYGTGE